MSEVDDNRGERRYELVEDDETAFAAYRLSGETITFTHTIVPEVIGGRGVGSRLIKGALADVRARGLKVVAECAFVTAYIAEHAEERDLLA